MKGVVFMNINFKADTALPQFLPYPKFLVGSKLSLSARVVYALLLQRTTLSQMNGWTDEDGKVFVVYPIEELASDLGCSTATVKRALLSLDEADLIERRRYAFDGANRIFLKLPMDQN